MALCNFVTMHGINNVKIILANQALLQKAYNLYL
jgi:hypothetical protein